MTTPPGRLHGIDVSKYNAPDWPVVSKTSQFVFVRATYGRTRDPMVVQHVTRARAAGLAVGLYAFFRPSEPVLDQFDAFCDAAAAAGYGVGDIIPALDIEADGPKHPVGTDWQQSARELVTALSRSFGECLIYITQRDFAALGKPRWLLEHPLWVAHWGVHSPATPANRPWAVWQYVVCPYNPGSNVNNERAPLAIDHNWAIEPLPRVRAPTAPPLDPADPSVVAARQLDLTEGIPGRAAENIGEDERHDTEPSPAPVDDDDNPLEPEMKA